MSKDGEHSVLIGPLRRWTVADLCDAATRLRMEPRVLDPRLRSATCSRFAGRAITRRVAPTAAVGALNDPRALHELIALAGSGVILVVMDGGDASRAFWDENMTLRALDHGLVGFFTDGAICDLAHVCRLPFAIRSPVTNPRGGGYRYYASASTNIPIQLGSVTMVPGDFGVGGDDGVVILSETETRQLMASEVH